MSSLKSQPDSDYGGVDQSLQMKVIRLTPQDHFEPNLSKQMEWFS